jgi:serine/threonine-protein kinase
MEYLQGQDLAERLEQNGPMPEGQVAEILLQALEALAEAHAAGIVHRDLKPANLFLARRPDGSEVLKILDFGISKISTSSVLTRSQTLVGSPYYMSPEQLESALDVDARADIWAAGVIMYELSTGERPFEGNSLAALCVSVLNAVPKPLDAVKPSTTPQFAAVVLRCLRKNRNERFQNVGELANALDSLRGPEAISSGAAARVTKVLQNARTVPDIPRRESDAAAERSSSWAQTNREATGQQQRGRRFILATVVIVAAGGVGVALGQLAQREPGKEAAFGDSPQAEIPRVGQSVPSHSAALTETPLPTTQVAPNVLDDTAAPPASASASATPSSTLKRAGGALPKPREAGVTAAPPRVPGKPGNTEPAAESERDLFLRRH